MPTQTLHFESARQAQQLFNNETRNLQAVEQELGVKVTCRDGWIKLDGSDESIAQAQKLFELIDSSLRAGTPIRNREFSQSLTIIKEHGSETLQKLLEDRIQTSPRKAPISPKTTVQKAYLEAIRKHDATFGIGPAGTGKTYLAMAMAVSFLKANTVARIILTRPAVEAGEALGFLPGDLYEKLAPYLRPLHDALHDMLPAEEIQKHMDRGTIEIAPLAYMRGRTLNNSFIILDEAQNATTEQMFMFLTRLGINSRTVVTGDPTQIDLPPQKPSGLKEAKTALKRVRDIAIVEFRKQDVIRHPLVKKIIAAYETHRNQGTTDQPDQTRTDSPNN
ncbi:MAG: PhoH-like protein [Verrucomicrobia subdivision 3 bacterium]|nr:PhoH-like protein [Limisphaerales bacterium]MCS1414825.1 PhoH-like protein [Limisphaerales bacterium]